MKDLWRILLPGTLVFLTGCLLLNSWYVRVIRPESILEKQFETLENPGFNPSTIILGDSHTAHGLYFERRPDSLFNFSTSGDEFTDFLAKTSWLQHHKTGIKTVFIQIDLHNFFTLRPESPSSGGGAYLRRLDRASFQKFHQIDRFATAKWQAEQWFPILNNEIRGYIKTIAIKNLDAILFGNPVQRSSEIDGHGNITWLTGLNSMSTRDSVSRVSDAQEKITFYHHLHLGMPQRRIQEFEQLISLWKAAGIRVVGLKMPLMKEYRELAAPFLKINPDSLALKSGVDEIWDFSDWADADASLFCDPNHLSLKGAKKFTAVFEQKRARLGGE